MSLSAFCQYATFNSITLTGPGVILQGPPNAAIHTISLNNDDITGLNQLRFQDLGQQEGIVFDSNIDISVYTSGQGGYNGFTFRSSSSYPFVFSGANFGIGTTTPDYALDVNGTIRCEELMVQNVSADFVFEKDYKLRSLSEVEAFINKNGHLPGIAPASETVKDLKISEFNTTLLQKVEELTLYMIELKKENEILKNEINELKNKE